MRHLIHLTGHHRTVTTNRVLGLLLAFNAGAVNAGGFLVAQTPHSPAPGHPARVEDARRVKAVLEARVDLLQRSII